MAPESFTGSGAIYILFLLFLSLSGCWSERIVRTDETMAGEYWWLCVRRQKAVDVRLHPPRVVSA